MPLVLTPLQPGPDTLPADVRAWLAGCDPVRDLLLFADIASSLARHSRVWAAREGDRVRGLAFAFPLSPTTPALGVKGESDAVERRMLESLVASGDLTHGFVITDPAQRPLYEATGRLSGAFDEHHMVVDAAAFRPTARSGAEVRLGRLDELDAFYHAEGLGAWNPLQFATGPHMVVEVDGRVVAAAGTQFAYEGLAQVGNVLTVPAHRGCGHAERLTSALTAALLERGHPTVSLFVAQDNPGAIRVYERLGYRALRPLDAFAWHAFPQG